MRKGFIAGIILLFTHSLLSQPLFQKDSMKVAPLNTKGNAEVYPFLSPDGLRLYFTSDRDGFARMYFSERKSVNDQFSAASPLDKNLADTFYEGSLTADELAIYLYRVDTLFVAKRSAGNKEFSTPQVVQEITGCYYAPAISPDGNELMAIRYWACDSTLDHTSRMDHFIKNKNGKFALYNSLIISKKYYIGPGSFSKDGLKFYMSIEPDIPYALREKADTCVVIRFIRGHLKDSFTTYTELYTSYLYNRLSQVTLNESETILIGVTGNKWDWEKTDLIYYDLRKKVTH